MNFDEGSNNGSRNQHFSEVLEQVNLKRRQLLKGGAGAAALAFFGVPSMLKPTAALAAGPSIGFDSVPYTGADGVAVPEGYEVQVLVAWGDPIGIPGTRRGRPAWRGDATEGEAEQLRQYGAHTDGMHFFGFPYRHRGRWHRSCEHGLLVANNEYVDQGLLFPDGMQTWSLEKVRKSQAAHGVSIVEVRRKRRGDWEVQKPSAFARRITANTPMHIGGPAAARLGEAGQGTVNNCAHGYTPWGTYLTCEENWNGYFGFQISDNGPVAGAPYTMAQRDAYLAGYPAEFARYGVGSLNFTAITSGPDAGKFRFDGYGFGYRWHEHDPRFDCNADRRTPETFGYVIEIDPFNPKSTPVKRTALGRIKHEGAWVTLARDGRVVVYMGDDQANEYIYKFVSRDSYDPRSRGRNMNLLEEGTLCVARFDAGAASGDGAGTGAWFELAVGVNNITPANGFATQADVCVKTRQAADLAGATKMDRPEWIAVHPETGEVYCTLTNNSGRSAGTVDDANPRGNNRYGHIIRWREAGGDAAATSFEWDIYLLAGDPDPVDADNNAATPPAVFQTGDIDESPAPGEVQVDKFGSPDGLWFDESGRLWIQTDISTSALGRQYYSNMPVNTMLCSNPATKQTKRFLTGPFGCEVTGVVMTPDRKTMFVGIQHPGEGPSDFTTPGNETAISHWPYAQDYGRPGRPRSAVVVITRANGGVIGE
jgi:hypothetical protein